MCIKKRDCRLLIYFSGTAMGVELPYFENGKEASGIICVLNDGSELDLRDHIRQIDKPEFLKISIKSEIENAKQEKKAKQTDEESKRIKRLSEHVVILYDVVGPRLDDDDAEFLKFRHLLQPHVWRPRKLSASNPYELVMLNRTPVAKTKRLDPKVELGSYSTELLLRLFNIPTSLPLRAPIQ
jgi:hypothetical protein